MHSVSKIWGWIRAASRYPEFRIGLVSFFIVFVVYGLTSLFVLPVLNKHAVLEKNYAVARRAATEAVMADQITAAYKTAKKALPVIEARLSKPIRQSNLVLQTAQLAKRAHVIIQSQTYGKGKSENYRTELEHEIVVSGRYRNIYRFVTGLSSLNNWITVKTMRLERTGKNRMVRASLSLITTSQKHLGKH